MAHDDPECPYCIHATDAEVDAMVWLIKTLKMICEHARPNADKAETARLFFERWGSHMSTLHERVHELENVLHSIGMEEIDPSQIEALAPDRGVN